MGHLQTKSALVIARLSELDHALASVVIVIKRLLRGKIRLRDAGSHCSFSSAVGDGILYFTFKLITRVRQGLVSTHAGRTLTTQHRRNIVLKQEGKDCAGLRHLVGTKRRVTDLLGSKEDVTVVYRQCGITQGAFSHFETVFLRFAMERNGQGCDFSPRGQAGT